MPMTEAAYHELALADPQGKWELHCGQLREKPPVSWEHSHLIFELYDVLRGQVDQALYRIRANIGRVRRSSESYYIPDLSVIPVAAMRPRCRDLLDRRRPCPHSRRFHRDLSC
ncbi:MAG: Uma2 family endonuclease [Acetobacteraceae bacterium]|nr:Uma2 family endonuclease [Acetobacteraceae bacterium]